MLVFHSENGKTSFVRAAIVKYNESTIGQAEKAHETAISCSGTRRKTGLIQASSRATNNKASWHRKGSVRFACRNALAAQRPA
jgi:hypothetical protein